MKFSKEKKNQEYSCIEFLRYILLLILILNCLFCSEILQRDRNEKEGFVTVVVNSDDPENLIFLSVPQTFENSSAYERKTQKKVDTIIFKIKDWDLLIFGSKKTFLDSLIVKKFDTVFISYKNEKIYHKIKNVSIEKRTPALLYQQSQSVKIADSLYKKFLKIDFDSVALKLRMPYFNMNLFRFIPNKEAPSDDELKLLLKNYRESLFTNNEEFEDQEQLSFSNNLLKREIFKKLKLLNDFFPNSLILDFLKSDFFLNPEANKSSEHFYLTSLIFLHSLDTIQSKAKLQAEKLFRLYDSLPDYLGQERFEKARMVCIEKMILAKADLDSIHSYINNFKETYNNTYFDSYIQNKYFIDLKKAYASTININFINIKGDVHDFENLLKSFEGKIVYLNFWASWCAPCLRAMPLSRALQDKFKEHLVVVYLSIDRDREAWKRVSKKQKIDDYLNNYLILDHHNSNFTNVFKIDRIPRYFIYDKNGNLINHDAPGPENTGLKRKIVSLIKDD